MLGRAAGCYAAWRARGGVGLASIVLLRLAPFAQPHSALVARLCTACVVLYVAAMVAVSQVARGRAVAWLAAQGIHAGAGGVRAGTR